MFEDNIEVSSQLKENNNTINQLNTDLYSLQREEEKEWLKFVRLCDELKMILDKENKLGTQAPTTIRYFNKENSSWRINKGVEIYYNKKNAIKVLIDLEGNRYYILLKKKFKNFFRCMRYEVLVDINTYYSVFNVSPSSQILNVYFNRNCIYLYQELYTDLQQYLITLQNNLISKTQANLEFRKLIKF